MTLPSLIGQYRILRKIGAGGMGLVYLGEHTLLQRRAAIKTLLPTVAANREIVERFFNEARATSAITDPGVIQIFDFGYHVDGTAYIVMELLEGESLAARLDRLGKLALGDALRFARQITGSLAAAHARDIVHRDLKPENIFLVRDAEAQGGERTKIIDFGICKVGAGDPMLTEVGAMIGTPVYMSPEQCRGSGEVDARSDIYAFGCLLFHLLTGRPPFVGEASGELVVAHLEQDPPLPSAFAPELSPAVDALVLTCLAKQPEERYASMTALQAALGELEVDTEAAAPVALAPARTVPLGRGFRSMYDANLASALGTSVFGPASPVPAALRGRLSFAVPPLPGLQPAPDDEDDDEEEDLAPRSRAGVRAALACVLVIGVAVGLIITPLIRSEDSASEPSSPAPRASLSVEAAPAVPAVAPPAAVAPGTPSRRAVASAIAAPATPSDSTDERPRRPLSDEPAPMQDESAQSDEAAPTDDTPAPAEDAPRPPRATASKPAPRRRINAEPRTGRPQASAPRSSGPVRSPAELEPARPEPARPVRSPSELPPTPPARSSPAPVASPPPPRPPPPPSTEDLYDTR